MSGANKAVIDGKMGVNRAADQYGDPRSTLKDRVSARHGARSGPRPYLSYKEEELLIWSSVLRLVTPRLKDESLGKPFTG